MLQSGVTNMLLTDWPNIEEKDGKRFKFYFVVLFKDKKNYPYQK